VNVQDITGGSTWAIAAAAFSNPMYLSGPLGKSDNSNLTGFQITPGAAVVVGFEGTYSGATVSHEQTMDPTGAGGWFSVEGSPSTGGSATSAGSTSGVAYVFTCIGVQHRIKVTALASGTITARIRLEGEAISTSGGAGGGSATEATLLEVLADTDALVTASQSTDTVNVSPDTATIMNGSVQLTPKFAAISASASADLVALVSSKKIRVVSFFIVVTTAVTVKLQSGGTSDLTGAMPFGANGGISLPYNPNGWFETASGEKLNMVLGSGVAVAGGLSYIEV